MFAHSLFSRISKVITGSKLEQAFKIYEVFSVLPGFPWHVSTHWIARNIMNSLMTKYRARTNLHVWELKVLILPFHWLNWRIFICTDVHVYIKSQLVFKVTRIQMCVSTRVPCPVRELLTFDRFRLVGLYGDIWICMKKEPLFKCIDIYFQKNELLSTKYLSLA